MVNGVNPAQYFPSGLSCPAVGSCIEIGVDNANGSSLVETLSNGTWSVAMVPVPSGGYLEPDIASYQTGTIGSAVSCPAVGSCVALGTDGSNAFIDTLSNGTWTPTTVPLTGTGNSVMSALSISCQSASSCVIVGQAGYSPSSGGTDYRPFIDALENGTWTASTPVVPSSIPSQTSEPFGLGGISCATATTCGAIGYYESPGQTGHIGFIDTLSNGTWNTETLSTPSGELSAISCASATACVASGYTNGPAAWTIGSTATLTQLPIPSAQIGSPYPVSFNTSDTIPTACPTATSCVALAPLSNNLAHGSAINVIWQDGSTWSVANVATNIQQYGQSMSVLPTGISCPTATTCYATLQTNGNYSYAATLDYNGSSWQITSATPIGSSGTRVAGIACPNATSCYAPAQDGYGKPPVVETLAGGKWTAITTPLPTGATNGTLTAIMCPTATTCYATGYVNSSGYDVPLVDTLANGSWTAQTPALPAGTSSYSLNAVSCTSTTACIAGDVGPNGSGSPAEVYQLANGTWTPQTIPLYPSTVNGNTAYPQKFMALTCAPGGSCTAVGMVSVSYSGQETYVPTVTTLNNGIWSSAQALPAPAGGLGSVGTGGVACASTTACAYVGTAGIPYVEQLTGTTWTATTPTAPTVPTISSIGSVSCPSPVSCVAIGGPSPNYATTVNPPDIYTLSGATWSVQQPPPMPPNLFVYGQEYGRLKAVSCAAVGSCIAVGTAPATTSYGGTGHQPLVATLINGQWTSSVAAAPAGYTSTGDGANLSAISCASTSHCVAVGHITNVHAPLIEILAGGKWTATVPPLPSGHTTGRLTAISCATATACVAVGATANTYVPFVETLANGSWTVTTAPLLPGFTNGALTGASCASATSCIITGEVGAGINHYGLTDELKTITPVVERLNNGKWAVTAAPLGTGQTSGMLTGASCVTTTSCVVVGIGDPTSPNGAIVGTSSIAETLTSGGTWAQSSIAPATDAGLPLVQTAGLSSVSCATQRVCVAVGGTNTLVPYAVTSLDLGADFAVSPSSSQQVPVGQSAAFHMTPAIQTYPYGSTVNFTWGYYGTLADGTPKGSASSPIPLPSTSAKCDTACISATQPLSQPTAASKASLPPGNWTLVMTTNDAPYKPLTVMHTVMVTAIAACNPTVAITSGNNQSAQLGKQFAQSISIKATCASGTPDSSAPIKITLPTTGPTGSYPTGTPTTITTTSTGVATIPAPVATGTTGTWLLGIVLPGAPTTAVTLTNTAVPPPPPNPSNPTNPTNPSSAPATNQSSATSTSAGLINTGFGGTGPTHSRLWLLDVPIGLLIAGLALYCLRKRHTKLSSGGGER
ncbi:MAG: hypothetical protein ACYDEP_02805 [Acidimicrobiales bacterium]